MTLNLTLDLIFVPRFGALAAAAVSSFGYGLMFVLVAAYFRSKTGKGFSESLVIGRDELKNLLKIPLGAAR